MVQKFDKIFEIKSTFLVLFGLTCLLFSTVGYLLSALSFTALIYVLITYKPQKRRISTIQGFEIRRRPQTEIETAAEIEDEDNELDDLLMLDPLGD